MPLKGLHGPGHLHAREAMRYQYPEQLLMFRGSRSILILVFLLSTLALSFGHLGSTICLNLGNIQVQKALLGDMAPTGVDWATRNARYSAGSASPIKANHLSRAVQYLELATAWDGNSARAYGSLGLAQLALEDWASASATLSKAIELEPARKITYLDLGNAYWEWGHKERARAIWQQGGWLEAFKRPYLQKAERYLELGEYSAAEESIRIAEEIDPNDGYVYFLLGRNYLGRQQWEPALLSLQTATRLGVPDWAKGLVHAYLGHAYKNLGQSTEALAQFSKAVEINPNDVWAWLEMGHISSGMGIAAKSVEYYLQARAVQPELAVVHYYLGKAYYEQTQLEAAVHELQLAIKFDPSVSDYHLYLARALWGQGRIQKAKVAYENALALQPYNEQIQRELQMLSAPETR